MGRRHHSGSRLLPAVLPGSLAAVSADGEVSLFRARQRRVTATRVGGDVVVVHDPLAAERLESLGYSDREIAQIGATLDLFDYANQKYLILATAVAASLVDDRALGSSPSSDARDRLPRSPVSQFEPIPVMVEEHHANADLRALYDDIKLTLNLPFVNSDYKAMARWPTYLEAAWAELKPRLCEPPCDVLQAGARRVTQPPSDPRSVPCVCGGTHTCAIPERDARSVRCWSPRDR